MNHATPRPEAGSRRAVAATRWLAVGSLLALMLLCLAWGWLTACRQRACAFFAWLHGRVFDRGLSSVTTAQLPAAGVPMPDSRRPGPVEAASLAPRTASQDSP